MESGRSVEMVSSRSFTEYIIFQTFYFSLSVIYLFVFKWYLHRVFHKSSMPIYVLSLCFRGSPKFATFSGSGWREVWGYNFYIHLICTTWMCNLYVQLVCTTFIYVYAQPLCTTFYVKTCIYNFYLQIVYATFMWNLNARLVCTICMYNIVCTILFLCCLYINS